MSKNEQQLLQRRIQRDLFADRASIEGPMFECKDVLYVDIQPETDADRAARYNRKQMEVGQ